MKLAPVKSGKVILPQPNGENIELSRLSNGRVVVRHPRVGKLILAAVDCGSGSLAQSEIKSNSTVDQPIHRKVLRTAPLPQTASPSFIGVQVAKPLSEKPKHPQTISLLPEHPGMSNVAIQPKRFAFSVPPQGTAQAPTRTVEKCAFVHVEDGQIISIQPFSAESTTCQEEMSSLLDPTRRGSRVENNPSTASKMPGEGEHARDDGFESNTTDMFVDHSLNTTGAACTSRFVNSSTNRGFCEFVSKSETAREIAHEPDLCITHVTSCEAPDVTENSHISDKLDSIGNPCKEILPKPSLGRLATVLSNGEERSIEATDKSFLTASNNFFSIDETNEFVHIVINKSTSQPPSTLGTDPGSIPGVTSTITQTEKAVMISIKKAGFSYAALNPIVPKEYRREDLNDMFKVDDQETIVKLRKEVHNMKMKNIMLSNKVKKSSTMYIIIKYR